MSSVAVQPDINGTVERIMSGELFTGLLFDDPERRAAALEALLGRVVEDDTRLIWVGNPLRSPLTIERLLIQIVGPEIDLREDRNPAELARLIAKPAGQEGRLLIVVQQPETIDARLRQLLIEMGTHLSGMALQVQFLFAGSSAVVVPQLAQLEVPAFSIIKPTAPPVERRFLVQAPRRRDVFPILMLLLTAMLGAMISMTPASRDGMSFTASADDPAPRSASLDLPLLRREFDRFLAQRTPTLPPMTDMEMSALFAHVLTHRRH